MGALLLEMLRPMPVSMDTRHGTTLTVQASRPSTFHKDDMMVRLELVTECEHHLEFPHLMEWGKGGPSWCRQAKRIRLDPNLRLLPGREESDPWLVQDVLDALEQP